ncbi:MAG: hypothetical protein ABW007_07895 [Chitinophagaceae bacterium]
MRKEEFFKILRITGIMFAFSFTLWFLFSPIPKSDDTTSTIKNSYSRITTLTFFITLFWILYFSWLWRFAFFQKLILRRPNLEGSWGGYAKSDFQENTLAPFKIVFSIKQSFFSLKINSFTEGYAAVSYGESLHFDLEGQRISLTYHFSQRLNLPRLADPRQGAGELYLNANYLTGRYWTVGKTYGFLRLNKISNENISSYEEFESKPGASAAIEQCYMLIISEQVDDGL